MGPAPPANLALRIDHPANRVAHAVSLKIREEGEPASAVAKRLSQKYSRRKRDVYAMVLNMQ